MARLKSRVSEADRAEAEPSTAAASHRAYIDALKMLSRRELSEAQVRERLARRGCSSAAAEAAITRLKNERAIDDARTAEAIARTELTRRRRGRVRVMQRIEQAGIARSVSRKAVDEVFGGTDEHVLIDAALTRRLRDGAPIPDERVFRRLYRFLVAQGFESDAVLKALRARSIK